MVPAGPVLPALDFQGLESTFSLVLFSDEWDLEVAGILRCLLTRQIAEVLES